MINSKEKEGLSVFTQVYSAFWNSEWNDYNFS